MWVTQKGRPRPPNPLILGDPDVATSPSSSEVYKLAMLQLDALGHMSFSES